MSLDRRCPLGVSCARKKPEGRDKRNKQMTELACWRAKGLAGLGI